MRRSILLFAALLACRAADTDTDTGDPPADADADGYPATSDCDDASAAVNPGATELCNGTDDDCDGATDEEDGDGSHPWFADADLDAHGDPDAAVFACEAPAGSVAVADDCDDADPAVHPGAEEVWYDGVDQDCDGASDFDRDGDGVDAAEYGGDDCVDDDPTLATCDCEVIGCEAGDLCLAGVCEPECQEGKWVDVSGNGHHAILKTFSGTSSSGWVGTGAPDAPYALQFDGADDFAEIEPGTDKLQYTEAITIEFWTAWGGSGIVLYSNRDGLGECVGTNIHAGGGWIGFFGTTDACWNSVTGPAPQANVWTHLVFTYDAATGAGTLYTNGVAVAAPAASGPLKYGPASLPRLGEAGGVYAYKGRMAVVRVWDVALTADQVVDTYRTEAARFGISAPSPAGVPPTGPKMHLDARACAD